MKINASALKHGITEADILHALPYRASGAQSPGTADLHQTQIESSRQESTMNVHIKAKGNRFASLGQTITVEVDQASGIVAVRAPFYRRSIKVSDVASISACEDDGHNRGLLNWFVVGKATSPSGVRLNTGGKARVDLSTTAGERYEVVVDTMAQAEAIVKAIRDTRFTIQAASAD